MTTAKPKEEYRAYKRNRNLGKSKPVLQYPKFVSEHKPYTKAYRIDLAKHMLKYQWHIPTIKKITGLSIQTMLLLSMIEWYHPFKRLVLDKESTNPLHALKEVEDTRVKWLRIKRGDNNGNNAST